MAEKKAEPKKVQLTPEMANNLFAQEKRKLENMQKQRQSIEQKLIGLERTIFALDELSKTKSDETFVNLGNGVYIPAKVETKTSAKFMVGSEVFIEKDTKDILELLKTRKEKVVKDLQSISKYETDSQANLNKLYSFLMNAQKQAQAKK